MRKYKLSTTKRWYLEQHYRQYSDQQLGEGLGLSKSQVKEILRKERLLRTQEDRERLAANAGKPGPVYTAALPQPTQKRRLGRADGAVIVLTAALAFAGYLLTLAPTVSGEDSGELIAAAYTLGIPHPPGYPLWTLLGFIFTRIVPFGTIAWRVNLLSAVCAAISVAVVTALALKFSRRRWPAVCAGLAAAFGAEFWEQSVIAEVYALNALCTVCACYALYLWYEQRKPRFLYFLALAVGLGAANHHTILFLTPLFAVCVLYVARQPWRQTRLFLAAGALAALPLLLYAYLPLRAAADPPVNWGDPTTIENFVDVISRAQYKQTEDPKPARTAAVIANQFQTFATQYARQYTPWLAWLPLAGAAVLWRRNRFGLLLTGGLGLYLFTGLILVLNPTLDRQSIWLCTVFFIPAYLAAAVLMAPALDALAGCAVRGAPLRTAAWALGLCAAAVPFLTNYYANDKSSYYFARDYAANILATMAENALYFPTADHATFPVLYLHYAEGFRPDIIIANKYGYVEPDLYEEMPGYRPARAKDIPTEVESRQIERWIMDQHPGRPAYYSVKHRIPGVPELKMVDAGLLYRVVPGQAAPENAAQHWERYVWHTVDPAHVRGELTAEYILSDYYFAKGRHALNEGCLAAAVGHFDTASAVSGAAKDTLNNVATACAEAGAFSAAERYYARALKQYPEYESAHRNLAKLYLQQERYAEAIDKLDALLRMHPGDPEGHWLLVRALRENGDPDAALQLLAQMAHAQPRDALVVREMGVIYLEDKGSPAVARAYFTQALSMDPTQHDLETLIAQLDEKEGQSAFPGGASPFAGLDAPLDNVMPRLPSLPQMPGAAPLSGAQAGIPAGPGAG